MKALSFSTIFESNQVFLASIDSDQTPNLRVWKGQFALEAGQNMAELVGETTAYSDFVGQAYFYPEPSNVLLTIGKSHVTMWNLGKVFPFRAKITILSILRTFWRENSNICKSCIFGGKIQIFFKTVILARKFEYLSE